MTKPVTIPNAFATQSGNVPASELDANYNVLAAALNDIPTYGNYFPDTGAVNVMAINTAPLTAAYVAGLWVDVLVANTNNSVVTLNVNGLGPKSVVDSAGNPLIVGFLSAGSIYRFVYDGTSFRIPGQASSSTFTCGYTGFTGGTPITTIPWSRFGNIVALHFPSGVNTSSSTAFTVTGIPSYLTPASTSLTVAVAGLWDNGASVPGGSATIFSGGTLSFSKDGSTASNWTASGTKGFGNDLVVIYPVL